MAGAEVGQGCLSSPQSKSRFYMKAVTGYRAGPSGSQSVAGLEAGMFQMEASQVPFKLFLC